MFKNLRSKNPFTRIGVMIISVLLTPMIEASVLEEERERLKIHTATFRKEQNTKSLAMASMSMSTLLNVMEDINHREEVTLRKKLTLGHFLTAKRLYERLFEEKLDIAITKVQSTFTYYTSGLSVKECQKNGKNSPRKIASRISKHREEALLFARQEHVFSQIYAYCTAECAGVFLWDDIEKVGYPFYSLLSRMADCIETISSFFWTVEESLVRGEIDDHKRKGLLMRHSRHYDHLMAYWHDDQRDATLLKWTSQIMAKRFMLFFCAFSATENGDMMTSSEEGKSDWDGLLMNLDEEIAHKKGVMPLDGSD